MNLPNKLTLIRIALVPVCLIMLALGWSIPAALVFAAASITDFVDGYLARRDNLVTNFGKFADPIADKILTLSMMILMAQKGLLPVWLPIIVAVRELAVDGLRLIAVEQGKVVAAGMSGKIKTAMQMTTIIYCCVFQNVLGLILSIIVAALTIYSGIEYFVQLKDLFKKDLKG
ncbi:MAG: CDP-diacylglycerol--glycerol-3-phosphate 3-phosphatidyltransferase [Clostridia bacterium]|nr:CDP-diacylglycerol--glycerol-3-phosphate 3-phosphatidyltransferase [Clostridia bacterium]